MIGEDFELTAFQLAAEALKELYKSDGLAVVGRVVFF